MTGIPFAAEYAPPELDEAEILRYARVLSPRPEDRALLCECLDEILPALSYRAVTAILPIVEDCAVPPLGISVAATPKTAARLAGFSHVAVFAATVGMAPDRLVHRYGVLSPARALFHQAIGTERIEALCDVLEAELAEKGLAVGRRFSPGYGDLPLMAQRAVFALLEPARRIGLCLTKSLLMTPTKSVTALVPITLRKGE